MGKKDVVCIYMCIHTHTHIYMMEYCPPIKNGEILPFAETWMDPEIIILSQSQSKMTKSPMTGEYKK